MIGIIAAMEKELSLLCETMGKFETHKIAGFEYFTGKISGKDVVLLCCGLGKVNAAVGCTILIQQFKPICIINTGSAGGINPALKIGDAIISTGLFYHDVDVTAFGHIPGQIPRMPLIFSADEKLIEVAENAVDKLKKEGILPASFNHCRGILGTGDSFICDSKHIAEIIKVFPDVAAVEMEGAAIAHCCYLFSLPFLVIRALSDVAGTESPLSFEAFLPMASKHSADIVIKILSLC
jgi:adenosylhomocysteine nucleosidase